MGLAVGVREGRPDDCRVGRPEGRRVGRVVAEEEGRAVTNRVGRGLVLVGILVFTGLPRPTRVGRTRPPARGGGVGVSGGLGPVSGRGGGGGGDAPAWHVHVHVAHEGHSPKQRVMELPEPPLPPKQVLPQLSNDMGIQLPHVVRQTVEPKLQTLLSDVPIPSEVLTIVVKTKRRSSLGSQPPHIHSPSICCAIVRAFSSRSEKTSRVRIHTTQQ